MVPAPRKAPTEARVPVTAGQPEEATGPMDYLNEGKMRHVHLLALLMMVQYILKCRSAAE